MSDEVVNILHRITYEVHDRELEQAVSMKMLGPFKSK